MKTFLLKLILYPVVLLHLMLNGFFTSAIWLLTSDYDHDAAHFAAEDSTKWIDKFK